MVACNRLFKTITLLLGVYLLIINVVLWATEPSVNILLLKGNGISILNDLQDMPQIYEVSSFEEMHKISSMNYKGFEWFFDRISSFPGPAVTHGYLMTYSNILTGFSITGNWGIDFLLAIFRILSTPLLFVITVTLDILNNAIWFIRFFVV